MSINILSPYFADSSEKTDDFGLNCFLKTLRPIVRKCSRKKSDDVTAHYISVLFIKCTFKNYAPFKRNTKQKFSVFGESDSYRLSNFLQTHIFETSIIFLEHTSKLNTGILDLQK